MYSFCVWLLSIACEIWSSQAAHSNSTFRRIVRVTRLSVWPGTKSGLCSQSMNKKFFLKQKKRRNCQEKRSRKTMWQGLDGVQKLKNIYCLGHLQKFGSRCCIVFRWINVPEFVCPSSCRYTLDHFLVWAVLNSAVWPSHTGPLGHMSTDYCYKIPWAGNFWLIGFAGSDQLWQMPSNALWKWLYDCVLPATIGSPISSVSLQHLHHQSFMMLVILLLF